MVVALTSQTEVRDSLARLAGALEALEFGPDASRWSAERDQLARMIRTYLIPRTERPSPPTTVVLAGPTGSGKSTLLNSLLGRDVSRTGALRPTTRRPLVVAPPGHMDDDMDVGGVSCQVVSDDAAGFESVTLVDSPDIDSTSTEHRVTAEMLIDNADVVVFVSSALRYADDVPWQVLRRAVSRGAPVIYVLNRVGSPSAGAIVDFRSKLAAAGLDDDIVTVPEHHLAGDAHQIPELSVRSLRRRLDGVLADRDQFAARVFARVLRATVDRASALAREMNELADELGSLSAELSSDLAARVAALDLGGTGEHLYVDPPSEPSPRTVRQWKRRSRRIGREHMAGIERRLVDRILSVVHSDLRRWLTEQRPRLLSRNVDPAEIVPEVVSLARSSLEGWVEFVTRIADDQDERHLELGERILLEAALNGEVPPAAHILFGDEAPVLIERAGRELQGRLEVIYVQTGDLVVQAMRQRFGALDVEELGDAVGAVNATIAPAYA